VDVKAVKRRFLALNFDRIERTRNSLRENQRDALDLLPLFFHVNHPLLPGFVAKETPFGIADYSPSKAVKQAAIRLSKGFEYKRRPLMRYDISSVFLMGSSGTVAYSDKSDFDVWVCHSPDLNKTQLIELSQKAKAIEQWADGIGIEINIYLMDPDRFRAGEMSDLSGESSGSAQYHLLLDEFYRTSVLLAGCYPLWWLVPPEEEGNYDAVAHKLKHNRFIKEGECVDFGGLSSIPEEEFFGASMWQLFKAIDSPYKSVLKLMLMEVYAHERSSGDLLSQRYKRAVYEGKSDLTELDPYVMLYTKLDEYLKTFGDESRIDLLRRCFYFKVNLKVSEYTRLRNRNWRWQYMLDAVREWGWNENYLNILDSRAQWKIHRVTDERKILVDELTHCYRFLSDFVRNNEVSATIQQSDMNLLGRKLFATFERKAGKVEIINRGISGNLWESRLSLHYGMSQSGFSAWELYPGIVDIAQAAGMSPLKTSGSVLEVVAWAYFNKVLDSHSGVSVYAGASKFTSRELTAVVDYIESTFSHVTLDAQSTDDYAKNVRVINAVAIVNIGVDPMSRISGEGRQLMTSQTDALCYSGMHYNLVNTIDMLITTSWGEVLTQHYGGNNATLDCLCEYSRLSSSGAPGSALPFTSRSYSSARGMMIGLRIESLFQDVIRYFYGKTDKIERQYILAVGGDYYALSMQDNVLGYQCIGDYADVLEYLDKVHLEFCETVIDRYTLKNTVLPLIYKQNRNDVIQFFYYMEGERAAVYVLDELGALFHQQLECSSGQFLLTHFSHIFDSIYLRSQAHRETASEALPVSYCEIVGRGAESWRLVRRKVVRQPGLHSARTSLRVIGSLIAEGELKLKVFCGEKEFSSLGLGDTIFEQVAEFITSMRKSNKFYPIYVTDLDMPASVLSEEQRKRPATSHYLAYKKQLEQRFNDALAFTHNQMLSSTA